MPYKSIVFIFAFAIVAACSNPSTKESRPLWEHYKAYLQIISNKPKSAEKERHYYSDQLWRAFQESRSKSKEGKNIFNKILHNFPNEVSKVNSSKENHTNNTGCLMVMGVNVEKKPTDYFIKYRKENNRWVFDEIQIRYYFDGTKRFLEEAICDEDKQNKIWLKYMQEKQSAGTR